MRLTAPRVDPQLRDNDCGISAVKTMCDLLSVPMQREVIAATLRPTAEGTRLDSVKRFFDERDFDAHYHLLDPSDPAELARALGGMTPCIAVVRRTASVGGLHYVVVERVRRGVLCVLDPSGGRREHWSVAQFCDRAERVESTIGESAIHDRTWRLAAAELAKYGLAPDQRPTDREVGELFNKLAYFGRVRAQYGFRDRDAERAFLRDLLEHDHASAVPSRYRLLGVSRERLTIRAPVVLTVGQPHTREEPEPASELSPLRKLLREVGGLRRVWYIFLFGALLASITTHAAVLINQLLVDDVLPQFEVGALVSFVIGLVAFRLFDLCLYVYTKYVAIHLSVALDRFFLTRFGDVMLESRLDYLHSFTRGDLIERVGDSLKLKSFFTRFFARILVNAVVSLSALVILFALNWQLATVVLVGAAVLLALFLLVSPVLRRIEMRRFQAKAALFSKLVETVDGAQPIRALSIGGYFRHEIAVRIARYNRTQRKGKILDLGNSAAMTVIMSSVSIVILVLCARRLIVDQSLTLGQLLTFVALSGKIFSSLASLLEENLELQEHLVILRRYFDFEQPRARQAENDEQLRVDELAADGVAFAYQAAPILDGASLIVRRGEKVVLCGMNGSGKSTLVRVLAGLQEPTGGDVLVNGASRRLFGERELRDRVVLVSAEDALFNDTLRFNLTLGRRHSTKKVIDYAKRIMLYDAIVSHPDHLDRLIDEGGRNLSAGQRRKVLVMRALLTHADVIIFDEVFRGIDQASKAAIVEVLNEIRDRAFLIISHEPLGALAVDRVLELRQGRVVEQSASGDPGTLTFEWGEHRWATSA